MFNQPKFKRKLLASCVASYALAGVSGVAIAQDGPANADMVQEEVIVRGIRSSLERSIDIKRDATTMVEAITADDIGKMPDQNVAEALQRLPGVQIDRRDGSGTKVRIRGLDQNVTLLNGGTFVSGLEYFQLGEAKTEFDSSLEGIPSELLGGVEVYKSPRASLVEGGMGGIVNLKTRDAFSLTERLIAGNVKVDYGLDAQDAQPSAFIVVGNNWNDQFAAILSLSMNNSTVHNDSIQSFSRGNFRYGAEEGAVTSDGTPYIAPSMIYATDSEQERERIGGSLNLQWRPTDAMELGFDWFHSGVDITNRQYTVKHAFSDDGGFYGVDEDLDYTIDQSGEYNVLTEGYATYSTAENNTAAEVSDGSADNVALRFKHDNGGRVTFSGEARYAVSELGQQAGYVDSRFSPYSFPTFVGTDGEAGTPNGWATMPHNTVEGDDGSRTFYYQAGEQPTLRFTESEWLTNPDYYTYKSHWALGADVEQDAFAVRGDMEIDVDWPQLKTLKFGFRRANQETDFRELRYLTDFSRTEGAMQPNQYDADGNLVEPSTFNPNTEYAPGQAGIQEAVYYDLCGNGGIPAGATCDIDGDGVDDNRPFGPWGYFMDANIGLKAFDLTTSSGENMAEVLYGSEIAAGDANRWSSSPGQIPWETFGMNPDRYVELTDFFPSGGYQSNVLFADAAPMAAGVENWIDGVTPNSPGQWFEVPLESWNVKQSTTALYAEADFEGENVPYVLNLGLRAVHTEVDVTTAETSPQAAAEQWSIASDGWNSQGVLLDWNITTDTKTYWDYLPSLNFSIDVNDEAKVRITAAEVLARPNLQDLGKGFSKDFTRSTDADGNVYYAFIGGSAGNPTLDPFRAKQADVAYEWYFGELGLLSTGVFYKQVESFIANRTVDEFGEDDGPGGGRVAGVDRPFNGDGGSVAGLEFQVQQSWDSGFGASFNYTYSDSDADIDTAISEDMGLPGISEHAFNVMAFFENDVLSSRIAYTWRDQYLSPFRSSFAVTGIESGLPEYFDSYGQLDASVTWDFIENFSLVVEALNITGESQSSYLGYENQPLTYTSQEPRVVVGVNFRL